MQLTVTPGGVGLQGADLAGVVAYNKGADGEGLLVPLVGTVVEARASRASLVACVCLNSQLLILVSAIQSHCMHKGMHLI